MIYYITRYTGDSKDAGTKAPNDIESICRMSGWREIRFSNPNKDNKFKKLYVNFNNWKKLGKQVKKMILYFTNILCISVQSLQIDLFLY